MRGTPLVKREGNHLLVVPPLAVDLLQPRTLNVEGYERLSSRRAQSLLVRLESISDPSPHDLRLAAALRRALVAPVEQQARGVVSVEGS